MGQCTTFLIIWNDKKKFCALARSFWPSARFWDFFGLQKAFGLLQAKKIPKTGLRPKWPCRSTKFFFVLPHDDIVVHFSMKHYIQRTVSVISLKDYLKLLLKRVWIHVHWNKFGEINPFHGWPSERSRLQISTDFRLIVLKSSGW